jgi:hypothetical protein
MLKKPQIEGPVRIEISLHCLTRKGESDRLAAIVQEANRRPGLDTHLVTSGFGNFIINADSYEQALSIQKQVIRKDNFRFGYIANLIPPDEALHRQVKEIKPKLDVALEKLRDFKTRLGQVRQEKAAVEKQLEQDLSTKEQLQLEGRMIELKMLEIQLKSACDTREADVTQLQSRLSKIGEDDYLFAQCEELLGSSSAS